MILYFFETGQIAAFLQTCPTRACLEDVTSIGRDLHGTDSYNYDVLSGENNMGLATSCTKSCLPFVFRKRNKKQNSTWSCLCSFVPFAKPKKQHTQYTT